MLEQRNIIVSELWPAGWPARYDLALRRYFRGRVDEVEVDDLVQEVFLRLHAARRSEPIDNVERYMFTVARSVLITRHRNRQARGAALHQPMEERDEPVDLLSPERVAIGHEEYDRAVRAILALPPRARAAFQFHRFEHMTYQAIATRMGISKDSVKELIHRAIVRLAEEMEKDG